MNDSFTRELAKLAGVVGEEVTPEERRRRLARGARAIGASALGAGLGVGLGHLAADVAIPALSPLTASQKKWIVRGAGSLGFGAGLASGYLGGRIQDYAVQDEGEDGQ